MTANTWRRLLGVTALDGLHFIKAVNYIGGIK